MVRSARSAASQFSNSFASGSPALEKLAIDERGGSYPVAPLAQLAEPVAVERHGVRRQPDLIDVSDHSLVPRAARSTRSASLSECRACALVRGHSTTGRSVLARAALARTPRQVHEQRDVLTPQELRRGVGARDGDTQGTSTRQKTGGMAPPSIGTLRPWASARTFSCSYADARLEAVQRAVGDRYQVTEPRGRRRHGCGVPRAPPHARSHRGSEGVPPDVAASAMRHERSAARRTLGASLDHPNIVRVYDFGHAEGSASSS